MLDFHSRTKCLDDILSFISEDERTKFIILSVIHYGLLTALYIGIFFTNNLYYIRLILLVLIIQTLLNINDNGCFLMKLERKYIGKTWFGLYTIINYIFPSMNFINSETSWWLFVLVNLFGFTMIGIKLVDIYYDFNEEKERKK